MDLTYPNLLSSIKDELSTGRTESHAFLLWFLKNYYRLDDVAAADAVCDGPDDKGIDGIYVDENMETIDVFQCKLVQNSIKTLGDTQLKEFAGTLTQFNDPVRIEDISNTTTNTELANLLKSENVARKMEEGFTVRGVFLTNIDRDDNAIQYLGGIDNLRLFDKSEIESTFVSVGPTAAVGKPVSFDVFDFECSEYKVGDARAVFAPLKASELIQLDGITSNELFAWNVRGSLGRTKVNKDIAKSINHKDEHKEFLLFHNGLTLICEKVTYENDKVEIAGYSVVNGCQSLTSLYEHRTKVTDELRLMARLIELPPGSKLADKITHHSNNQNPINARDLQSNSTVQRRLQNEFRDTYGDKIFYRIKRGEADQGDMTIDNDEAGRLLLAFDLKQPWTCHQSYKVLDELHSDIYARPEVNEKRILSIHDISSQVEELTENIENKMMSSYRLTHYFLLYLARMALEQDDKGADFCKNPSAFVTSDADRKRLKLSITPVIKDLIIDLNAEVRERAEAGTPLDFKRELKSPNAVRDLSRSIISNYQKSVSRGRADAFGNEWKANATESGVNKFGTG